MKRSLVVAIVLAGWIDSVEAAPYVYVTNFGSSSPGPRATVSVIDAATDEVVADIPVGPFPEGVTVSPDGRTVYVANFDSTTLSVIDAATNTVRATIDGFVGPEGIAVSPDGQRLYVTNFTFPGKISVVDANTYEIVHTIDVGLFVPSALAISPDGHWLYATTRGSRDEQYPCNSVCLLPVFAIDTTIDHDITVRPSRYLGWSISIALSADGAHAFVPANPGHFSLWGLNLPNLRDQWTAQGLWYYVAVRPGSNFLYATTPSDISVIDAIDGSIVNTIPVSDASSASGLAITPDGAKVYVADAQTNSVVVVDANANVVSRRVIVGDAPSQIAIGPENPPFSPPPTQSPIPDCTGDCNRNDIVTIDEIIAAVQIALRQTFLLTCSACDRNHDGAVTIDELLAAVRAALNGCEPT